MTKGNGTPRIGFLYNHDAPHQFTHSAGVMREYVLANPDHEIIAMVSTKSVRNIVASMVGSDAETRISWFELSLPPLQEILLAPLNRIAPVYRLARLRTHIAAFAACDAIVSTERTCLWVKNKLGPASPKFIFIPHGAGDRNVSYHPSLSGFDLMLVSGEKVANEMIRHNLVSDDRVRITGYPKFDMVDVNARIDVFGNRKPVFLYNPHFDPVLSSWYDYGPELIRVFAHNPDLGNLIVAPHVMLFRKKFHFSMEFGKGRFRPEVPGLSPGEPTGFIAPNIFVDVASPRLFDMSYVLSADAYIGDASSQVYEFLINPRACFFFDMRGRKDAAFDETPGADSLFWKSGRVFGSVSSLVEALPSYETDQRAFQNNQQQLFHFTMSEPNLLEQMAGADREPASRRASRALGGYIATLGG